MRLVWAAEWLEEWDQEQAEVDIERQLSKQEVILTQNRGRR